LFEVFARMNLDDTAGRKTPYLYGQEVWLSRY